MRPFALLGLAATLTGSLALHTTPRHIPALSLRDQGHFQHLPAVGPYSSSTAAESSFDDDSLLEAAAFDSDSFASSYLERSAIVEHPRKRDDIVLATFTQPLDHFHNSTDLTFKQRYWYSLRHYRPPSERGGRPAPIFVLDSGETNAVGRLPYLDHGILDILAKATGGIGIVLEHRYYGTSYPPRSAFGPGEVWTVDELRWLTNEQALEDSARFVRELKIPGVDEDLSAHSTPVISYGGSYPGARSAHLRVLYPDLFFGSIASSAVTAAVEDFPHYFSPIARGSDTDCSQALQAAVVWIDSVVAPDPHLGSKQVRRDEDKTKALLELFNLEGLSNIADLANLLVEPLGSFQALNWDSTVSSTLWTDFCSAITGREGSGPIDNEPAHGVSITEEDGASSSSSPLGHVPQVVRNLATFMRKNYIDDCVGSFDVNECFGTSNWSWVHQSKHLSSAIAWMFQVCSTWGYFLIAPKVPTPTKASSTTTFHISAPKIVSSLLDHDYASAICREGFQPGKHYSLPAHPNVSEVNDIGGVDLAYDRLAFIDGQFDPWRPATPHSEEFAYGGARPDTTSRPFKLIANCWHHCDENGLSGSSAGPEPPRIQKIHEEEVAFVKAWLKEWKPSKARSS